MAIQSSTSAPPDAPVTRYALLTSWPRTDTLHLFRDAQHTRCGRPSAGHMAADLAALRADYLARVCRVCERATGAIHAD